MNNVMFGGLQGTGLVPLHNDQKASTQKSLMDIEKQAKIVEYLKQIPSEMKVTFPIAVDAFQISQ